MTHCFNPPLLLDFSLCRVFWSSAISASHFGLPIEKYLTWSQTPPPEFWMKPPITCFQLILRTSSQPLPSSFHLPLKLNICTRSDWDEAKKLTSFRAAHIVLCIAFGATPVLTAHWCFGYCWTGLVECHGFLSPSSCTRARTADPSVCSKQQNVMQ